MNFTCFDAVDLSIAGALESRPDAIVCAEKIDALRADCALIDHVATENECEAVYANVDPKSGDVVVSISCPVIEFENSRKSVFFGVIQHADKFAFSQDSDGNVLLSFTFEGIVANE